MHWFKQIAEKIGIYAFITALLLYTQINWMKQHNEYREMEIRLVIGFIVGILLSFATVKVMKVVFASRTKDVQAILNNVSLVLFPCIIIIPVSVKQGYIGGSIILLFCILISLYISVEQFRSIVNRTIFKDNIEISLIIEDNQAILDIGGTHEKTDNEAKWAFVKDLVKNYKICSELNIQVIKIRISKIQNADENTMKQIITALGQYFNLRIVYHLNFSPTDFTSFQTE